MNKEPVTRIRRHTHPLGWFNKGYSQFSSVWYSDLLQLFQMNLGDHTDEVRLTHPSTVAHITLSYIKISLSFTEVDCLHALWNKSLLQSFMAVHASKTFLYFSKNKCSYFSQLFRLSYIFITVVSLINSWNQTGILHWKWIPVSLFYRTQLTVNTDTLPYMSLPQNMSTV